MIVLNQRHFGWLTRPSRCLLAHHGPFYLLVTKLQEYVAIIGRVCVVVCVGVSVCRCVGVLVCVMATADLTL